MASVRYTGVSKKFDDGPLALDDFNLQVEHGELVVLVGPSGCGKSTALRLLAGLESVTQGELRIDSVNVNNLTPQQRNIAMVFQNYALYPHMTVRRNLEFPLRMMKLTNNEIQQRTAWAADMLQLDELLDRTPKQLSGGQRQRVAMGRAIVREPRVFLMDEPLSNLDAKLRVQIRTSIAALQRKLDITTLYVTHDQVEAMTLGDRVAVMDAGRIQQVDKPQALYEHPANVFVARFIGSPGMNILDSRLRPTDSGLAFELFGQWLEVPNDSQPPLEKLAEFVDRPIQIGLRPEALSVASPEDASLSLPLIAVEALGHEQLLYFKVNHEHETSLVARVQGSASFSINTQIPLKLNLRELYVFDHRGQAIY